MPITDLVPFLATSILAFLTQLSHTSGSQNTFPINCSVLTLKPTYSCISIFCRTCILSLFIISFASSTVKIVTGDPVSFSSLKRLSFIKLSMLYGLCRLCFCRRSKPCSLFRHLRHNRLDSLVVF